MRCPWCPADDPLYVAYHDQEWGVPTQDGRHLFEMINLEGAQAGLSWRTILHKRERYREVFEGFDPLALSCWTQTKIDHALLDTGIVRNRLKVAGVIRNARALMKQHDGDLDAFSQFLWSHVKGQPLQNNVKSMAEVPAKTALSDQLSKALQKQDFTFVGSTICYAFMQAVGMVNDHLVTCPRHAAVKKLAAKRV